MKSRTDILIGGHLHISNLWVDVAQENFFFKIGLFTQALDKHLQKITLENNRCHKGLMKDILHTPGFIMLSNFPTTEHFFDQGQKSF